MINLIQFCITSVLQNRFKRLLRIKIYIIRQNYLQMTTTFKLQKDNMQNDNFTLVNPTITHYS